jgi:hypothetical protein
MKVDTQSFREQLRSRFEQNRNRVLLGILFSPGADPVLANFTPGTFARTDSMA